jgi:hypothetical protein
MKKSNVRYTEEYLDELVRRATEAALEVLDEEFPGANKGGIGDDVAYGIHGFILEKLKFFYHEMGRSLF